MLRTYSIKVTFYCQAGNFCNISQNLGGKNPKKGNFVKNMYYFVNLNNFPGLFFL